ncbi:hypothetical protein H311_03377 [Anncaliia algerae PRA109]|nr:hypothetical protein H311_03377 [Anncaliia algerae PRA109]
MVYLKILLINLKFKTFYFHSGQSDITSIDSNMVHRKTKIFLIPNYDIIIMNNLFNDFILPHLNMKKDHSHHQINKFSSSFSSLPNKKLYPLTEGIF